MNDLGEKWNEIGYQYDYGLNNRKENKKKAFRFFLKAALQNHALGCANLALFYRTGTGCIVNPEKSMIYELKAASNGHVPSMYTMSWGYKNGWGVLKDNEKAFYWSQKAADHDLPAGYRALAGCYWTGVGCKKNYKHALKYYQIAAENEDRSAMHMLGWMKEKGRGCTQDFKEAFYWYTKGAEQDHYGCMNSLGHLYEYGNGVIKNASKAFEWYKKATNAIDAPQNHQWKNVGYYLYCLASCYEHEIGCIRNLNQALDFYLQALEKGYQESSYRIGIIYNERKEYKLALEYFEKSGEECAFFQIGLMYDINGGYQENHAKALHFYLEGANRGCTCAIRALGISYENGEIVEKDGVKAFQWYLKGLDYPTRIQNCIEELSSCFISGRGCPRNFKIASNLKKLTQLPISNLRQRCSICLEKGKLTILPCLHQFHKACLGKLILNDEIIKCCLCRSICE